VEVATSTPTTIIIRGLAEVLGTPTKSEI
jgi:hypothetical protein